MDSENYFLYVSAEPVPTFFRRFMESKNYYRYTCWPITSHCYHTVIRSG